LFDECAKHLREFVDSLGVRQNLVPIENVNNAGNWNKRVRHDGTADSSFCWKISSENFGMMHLNVTEYPRASWTLQQAIEAFPEARIPQATSGMGSSLFELP
jgi:hypothetical protein